MRRCTPTYNKNICEREVHDYINCFKLLTFEICYQFCVDKLQHAPPLILINTRWISRNSLPEGFKFMNTTQLNHQLLLHFALALLLSTVFVLLVVLSKLNLGKFIPRVQVICLSLPILLLTIRLVLHEDASGNAAAKNKGNTLLVIEDFVPL